MVNVQRQAIGLCAAALLGGFVLRQDPSADIDITVTEGTNIAAVASPDRASIAMDLQGGLWILPIGGGEAKRITPQTLEARQPTWAPDSRSLAFQGYDDNAWHIYTIRADGTGLAALTDGPFDDREPDWSRDGARIAFSSDRFGGIYTAWTVDVRTRAVTQVSKSPGTMPCWAASDREVIFEGKPTTDQSKVGWWIAAPGGRERPASTASRQPDAPVAVPACANGRAHALGAVIASNGTATTAPGTGEDMFPFLPQWISPTELLYTADGHIKRRHGPAGASTIVPFRAQLPLRRPAYARKHRNLQPQGTQRAMGIVDPAVSPDGSAIAFTALGDLWLLPRRGARPEPGDSPQPIRLTDDPFVELDPAWSPDGSKLLFSSDRGGSMDLWVMDMRTRAVTQLTHEKGPATSGAWAPNGTRIAYLVDRRIVRTIDLLRTADPPRTHGSANVQDSGRPSWGPDGRVFATGQLFQYSDRYREGTNQLVLHSIDSERPLAAITLAVNHSAGNRQNGGPVWSPNGERMAYVSEGALMIVGVGPNGTPLAPPTPVAADAPDSPTWEADSRHVVYLSPDGLRRVSVDGGAPESIPIQVTWQLAAPPDRAVVHAGHLFDGLNDGLRSGVDIVVDGGRIREVKPHEDSLHTGAVIDASAETVMPGLIEMHAHLEPGYGEPLGRIWLSYGITTVRNPAVNPYWGLEMREAWESGRRIGPRVFNAGDPFDGTRIYYAGGISIGADQQLDRELDRATRLGYDFFKTYVRLPDRYQQRVIDYAHAHGLAVTSHEIYPAAAFGVDGVEHIRGTSRRGYSPKVTARNISYRDVVEILAKSGMTLTPTIGISGGFAVEVSRDPSMMTDPRLSLFPEASLESYRGRFAGRAGAGDLSRQDAMLDGYRRTVAAVAAAGGKIIAGTDSPIIPYGLALHSELLHFVEAGMRPFEALRTATSGAADALGVGDELGSIAPGKLADLVFVAGDPLRDLRAARDVRRVMRGGRLYTIDELLKR
jgi:Tol biopolymer transport system component/imidazolonepropionase-like amidohydrolase